MQAVINPTKEALVSLTCASKVLVSPLYFLNLQFLYQCDFCLINSLLLLSNCTGGDYCQEYNMAWNRISNSKVFLVPSTGLNSWSGRGEIIGFEAHDVGLGLEALSDGFGINNLLVECRSGEEWVMPPNNRAS